MAAEQEDGHLLLQSKDIGGNGKKKTDVRCYRRSLCRREREGNTHVGFIHCRIAQRREKPPAKQTCPGSTLESLSAPSPEASSTPAHSLPSFDRLNRSRRPPTCCHCRPGLLSATRPADSGQVCRAPVHAASPHRSFPLPPRLLEQFSHIWHKITLLRSKISKGHTLE